MADAKVKTIERRRVPRVFFLTPADYAEFCATSPDYGWFRFHQGSRPAEQFCPSFDGLAVRQSAAKKPVSGLFSCVGTWVRVPAS